MSVGQIFEIRHGPGGFGIFHFYHLGKQLKAQRGFGFIGMDKTIFELAAVFPGFKEFPHGPVPFQRDINARQLKRIHKSLDGLFDFVLLCVIVYPYLLAEAVIP